MLKFAALAAVFCLAALPALAIEDGIYRGKSDDGSDLEISVKKRTLRIEVAKPGCQGDVEGPLRTVGKDRWRIEADGGFEKCTVNFQRRGDRLEVSTKSCVGYSGPACGFDGYAEAGNAASASAAEARAPVPDGADAGWSYGEDPVLGLSAYVRIPGGAVGLACASDGSNAASAGILALRVTSSLVPSEGATYMFDARSDAATLRPAVGSGFVEVRDTTCGVSLEAFRASRSLFLVDGEIASLAAVGGGTEITINQAGRQTVVRNGAEAMEKLKGRVIPLNGSSRAIAKLIAACPAARRDIESNCGI